MIKTERDLWKLLKKSSAGILFNRIENWAIPGLPDLLGYNQNKIFFTLELKVIKGNKIRFSPHQVAWHLRHGPGAFILVARSPKPISNIVSHNLLDTRYSMRGLARGRAHPKKNQGSGFVGGLRAGGPTHFFLYKSSQIMDLVSRGIKTGPIVGGLRINEIIKYISGLGAKAPSP